MVYAKMAIENASLLGQDTVLYLDFGGFSAKATTIRRSKVLIWSSTNITGYEFSEDAGLEAFALRRSRKLNVDRNEVVASLSQIERGDPLFEEEVRRVIQSSTDGAILSEVQMLGGGANFTWINKLVRSIISNTSIPILHKFSAVDAIANFTAAEFTTGNRMKSFDVPGIPLYVSHGERRIQIKPAIGAPIPYFSFRGVENATFEISTNADRVGRGYETLVGRYEIANLSDIAETVRSGLTVSCRMRMRGSYRPVCTLCGDHGCTVPDVKVVKSGESDMIAALFKNIEQTDWDFVTKLVDLVEVALTGNTWSEERRGTKLWDKEL
jgi:hypothetical protein